MSSRSFPIESIASRILLLRGHKVMLDADLADLYGVPTKVLAQAVKRNRGRWGGRRKPLHGFTEQGVAMLSSVLRSPRAIAANIAIMRAFVRLREMVAANAELATKLIAGQTHTIGYPVE